jgi:hypothetical protein
MIWIILITVASACLDVAVGVTWPSFWAGVASKVGHVAMGVALAMFFFHRGQ